MPASLFLWKFDLYKNKQIYKYIYLLTYILYTYLYTTYILYIYIYIYILQIAATNIISSTAGLSLKYKN